ncbi:hypothetical protein VCHC48B2_1380 [Vibrio cholerae HC-48B2]|nr:hypothetical protein VCHC48B2_1380 [Vibrio cholerae HC-48B2]EJH31408.1 hypothetical protein VCCP104114_2134 [Vibrio cholerae CP1041(14)]EKG62727.1 hypothetical protein VCHC55A1_1392 [Vibrio cholerae HC-55A1]EKG90558.1 hypothetical protein VCHC81A2_1405 [Vibrio cholerae HC-81A2]EMQ06017.1 hypothetical protein VCEC0009_001678 [Vibrio cholerae O1 str. EC-0009]EMQ39316.1 hypothetical protein VCEM1626_001422 [Vibrio cholerae O1 str. EM-1626]
MGAYAHLSPQTFLRHNLFALSAEFFIIYANNKISFTHCYS